MKNQLTVTPPISINFCTEQIVEHLELNRTSWPINPAYSLGGGKQYMNYVCVGSGSQSTTTCLYICTNFKEQQHPYRWINWRECSLTPCHWNLCKSATNRRVHAKRVRWIGWQSFMKNVENYLCFVLVCWFRHVEEIEIEFALLRIEGLTMTTTKVDRMWLSRRNGCQAHSHMLNQTHKA